jgi:hypothetical protein
MKKKKRVLVVVAVASLLAIGFTACGSEKGSPCFYAPTCLDKCGGTIVKSGCEVTCEPPLVEKMKCVGMDAPDDSPGLIQDTGVETGPEAGDATGG